MRNLPIAGTPTVSMFNGKRRARCPAIALRGMDAYSKNSLPIPPRSGNSQEVWSVCRRSLITILGGPKRIQVDGGVKRGNGIRADFRTGRRIKVQFRERARSLGPSDEEMGSHVAFQIVWLQVVVFRAMAPGNQWRLRTLLPASGYSAYRLVFGSNPADLFVRGGGDEDLLCAQDTLSSGQFGEQSKSRMMAKEVALKGVANSEVRRRSSYEKSFNCTDL